MAVIVCVHGIDQQQQSADELEKEWLPALAGGIRMAGFGDLADRLWRDCVPENSIEARVAFYGNLFLAPDQQGAEGAAISQDQAQFAETLAQEWLQRSAERASKQKVKTLAASELAYVRGNMGEEVQGLGNVVRSAIKSLAKISWFAPTGMGFAERFVNRALAQVTKYLTEEETRKKAQEVVLALIGPETKVLIGHSLGSVVAYEVTHRLHHPLPLFVTLGSPLGLDSIIYPKLRPKPPAFPILVQRWMNLADRDDFIAAEPDLTKFFSKGLPQGARFEAGYTVDNGAEPHKATFYLKKEKFACAVVEALVDKG